MATANVVEYCGARPVFADIDLGTFNVDVEDLARRITPATRAIIPVHLFGLSADMDAVLALAREREIAVIEDAACAIGSTYRGRPVGGGRLVALSFHPRKLLTTGEGGMLLTSDAALARRLRRLRDHGMAVSAHERHGSSTVVLEEYVELGFNFRMTDLQAAVGLVQLAKLEAMVAERRGLAEAYRAALAGVPGLALPNDPPHGTTNYQSFVIRLEDDLDVERSEVMQHLLDRGVATRRGIMAAHLEPAFAGRSTPALPVTERLTRRSLILPLFHAMGEDELGRVAEALAEAVAQPAVRGERERC